jgi:hypothetical protein
MRTCTPGPSFRTLWKKLSLVLFAALLLQACSVLSCSNRNGVTGRKGDPTASGTQSETSATTALVGTTTRIVVTFNDDTNDGTSITYTSTGRHINSGASNMGWSYSDNGGATWNYGGKVKPPSGWPVLWGDPAVTTSQTNYSVVFMSNLAIPSGKFPSGGIDGSVDPFAPESCLGGACIAKSTDSGKTFAIYQCVTNTTPVEGVGDATQGHFYDGGSMVASNSGEVFASFVDVATQQIDVYRSPSDSGTFKLIAPPFPGMYVAAHPRMRAARDGSVYVAAQVIGSDQNTYVYLNRYSGGSWGKPIQASSHPTVFYDSIDFGTTVDGSELTLRVGNSMSYDVGASSPDGSDAIRLLYLRQDSHSNGPRYIDASACYADLHSCAPVPQWSFKGGGPGNSQVDVINPEVVAWPGFIGLPPTWQASWAYHYGKTNTVNVSRATLGYFPDSDNPIVIIPVDILQNTPVCSDSGRGYWGDYDSMLQVGWQGTSSVWMRFLADSSQGCPTRWFYLGETQHLQQANYAY